MKARFNYDLSEIKEMLKVAQVVHMLKVKPKEEPPSPRQRLIERVEYLTTMMQAEAEKARQAQTHLNVFRVQNILGRV